MKTISPYRLLTLTGILLLSGCANLFPPSCEQFNAQSKKTNYATAYRFDGGEAAAALPTRETARASFYQIALGTQKARPCSHVSIQKELVLVRREQTDLIFEETREFFAGNVRIVAKSELLTAQLNKSGRYKATVLLPIPQNAPAGKYRVVSTLSVKTKSGTATVLAKSNASFEVVATK